jgi:DNA-binding NarL/FixJ family response regulator
VDDHAVVRSGVKYMLTEFYKPCTVDEAENEEQVVEKIKHDNYELILLDINIPRTNTLELLRYILFKTPQAKVLMFSMNPEKLHAKRYLDAGAKGFLSKEAPVDEIKRAINVVLSGRKYYSETLVNSLLEQKDCERKVNPFEKLSEREYQIANLLLEGKSLTEISGILKIHTSTTGTHKAKIFEKLNVKNLVELIDLSASV